MIEQGKPATQSANSIEHTSMAEATEAQKSTAQVMAYFQQLGLIGEVAHQYADWKTSKSGASLFENGRKNLVPWARDSLFGIYFSDNP